MSLFKSICASTPLTDKIVIPLAAAANVAAARVGDYISWVVGGLTCLVLIPRIIIGWTDLYQKLRLTVEKKREGEEKA